MGKIIRNCPCCMRGVCTCCCSKSIGRTMQVTFTISDSDDGNGGQLSCCLDDVTIEAQYTEDATPTHENLWLGSVENVCEGTLWVAVRCPPEGRSLVVGVACAEERPGKFSDYQFFTKNITIDSHRHPYLYGFSNSDFAPQNPTPIEIPVLDATLPFQLQEPVESFDEEFFLRWDSLAEETVKVDIPSTNPNKAWYFNNDGMYIHSSSLTLGPTQAMAAAMLVKNTDVSDVFMQIESVIQTGRGLVLRKNDTGFIWIWMPNSGDQCCVWKVTGLDNPNGIDIETLGGLSHIALGNEWERTQAIGGGLNGTLATGPLSNLPHGANFASVLTVEAIGEKISVYYLSKKLCEVHTDFNIDATQHGLSGTEFLGLGKSANVWVIYNMPSALDYAEACPEDGTELQFEGYLYSGYNEDWPSQNLSGCGCEPAEVVSSYMNIKVVVTATLSNRECDEDCIEALCDDCLYSSCIFPTEITVTGEFSTDPDYIIDTTLFSNPATLYKLTKYDNVYFPTLNGFIAYGSRENIPKWGGGIAWSGTFQDDLVLTYPSLDAQIVGRCIYLSDFFEVELSPESQVVLDNPNELHSSVRAATQITKFRWELHVGGSLNATPEVYVDLFLVCEREAATVVYEKWSGTISEDECDGPWELTRVDSNSGISGVQVARGTGGNPWLITPETITVQPVLPEDTPTLNVVCPYCCDGEGYVGRDLLLDIDDENNDANDISSIPLTMDVFGQCVTSLYYNGDALFQWSSPALSLAAYPQLVSWGDDCPPDTITSWTIKLQCRFHQTNSDSDECPVQQGANCRPTWRLQNCGHFDWVLLFIPNASACRYPYSNDIDFDAGDPSLGGYGTMLPTELTSGCNPFYVSGEIQQLGPNSVTRNVVIHE